MEENLDENIMDVNYKRFNPEEYEINPVTNDIIFRNGEEDEWIKVLNALGDNRAYTILDKWIISNSVILDERFNYIIKKQI